MKLDATYLIDVATQTKFDPYNIEKVLRLKDLLRERGGTRRLRSSAVLNMGTSTMILTSKHEIPWTDEEPQTNAKNAYVCAHTQAPKGRPITAQGNALGLARNQMSP